MSDTKGKRQLNLRLHPGTLAKIEAVAAAAGMSSYAWAALYLTRAVDPARAVFMQHQRVAPRAKGTKGPREP